MPTANGFLYLAVVLDAWSRKIVGWSMANHLRAELVVDALEMAIGHRRPGEVIHHSDRGSQYTSLAFGKRCKEAGVRPAMGSVGDAYDNAMCESFFATLECQCELLDRRRFASQAEARMACFSFIEGWYNPVRLHSALGYRSPIAYEAAMVTQAPNHSTKAGQLHFSYRALQKSEDAGRVREGKKKNGRRLSSSTIPRQRRGRPALTVWRSAPAKPAAHSNIRSFPQTIAASEAKVLGSDRPCRWPPRAGSTSRSRACAVKRGA